ncbi:MAG: ribosomal protein S18-alanine N-acetyltransferase [Geodermatophilaceae bacterium]|nr:ribosomal protein S18-alanine N-acetyltransferase [Geodermatophilaceae bacterium]
MSSVAPQQKVLLRPLTIADLPMVMLIEEELFAPDMWTEAMLRDELSRPQSRYYLVAEAEEQIVGYAGLVTYRDEGHIATLAVRKTFQGNGIGALLLDALLAEADHRVNRVLLEVRADNPVPQQLYRSRGFAEIGRRPNYYPFSGADAVVMSRG